MDTVNALLAFLAKGQNFVFKCPDISLRTGQMPYILKTNQHLEDNHRRKRKLHITPLEKSTLSFCGAHWRCAISKVHASSERLIHAGAKEFLFTR